VALLLVMSSASTSEAWEYRRQPSLEGRVTIDAAFEARPRRCVPFLIPGRGIVRECPVGILGGGLVVLRPTAPLLVRARVAAGVRHIRNSALIHTLAAPGEAVGAIPMDMFLLDADVGIGLWSYKGLFEVSAWAGPSLLFEQASEATIAGAGAAGIQFTSTGRLMLGGRIHGQLDLVVEDALRIGFRVGLDVLGTAAFLWSPGADELDIEVVRMLDRTTDVRTLLSLVVAAPPEGPVALVADIGAATGWALVPPATQAALEEQNIEADPWLHIWPEFRMLIGVRIRPPEY